MSYAMLYVMLHARTYDMQVKTDDVVYDENILCRMSDLRYRMHIRNRILRCRTCLTYDIDILCRTCTTYDIVRVQCRTCLTYDIVCNICIIRCRTSDVRHSMLARIQMKPLPQSSLRSRGLVMALEDGARVGGCNNGRCIVLKCGLPSVDGSTDVRQLLYLLEETGMERTDNQLAHKLALKHLVLNA